MLEKLPDALAANPALAAHFDFADLAIGLVAGEDRLRLHLTKGAARIEKNASPTAFDMAASNEDWALYASERPPVGYQTLSGMMEVGAMKASGEGLLELARYMFPIEQLFRALRPNAPIEAQPWAEPEFEAATGRYLRVNIHGRPQRIYVEEAGQGVPLLCLHTAGSDGRQYRALFNDPEITARFRVIAFDLPSHGKSSPDPGFQDRQHMLTTDSYIEAIMAVKRAMKLERPVAMGCSIGGRAVLHLALRHGDEFRACIGLQSAMYAESHALAGLLAERILCRPDICTQETSAAAVWALMGPNTPQKDQWETLWYYMQGGPGIFAGDLVYYFADGDLRNGLLDPLDPDRCPLYLLTGEYDLSATPAMTAELAKAIKARHFEVIPGVGHFPMSEDPETFRRHLLPVLARIEKETN